MALDKNWNSGGSKAEPHPSKTYSLRDMMHLLSGVSIAQLKVVKPLERFNGMPAFVVGKWWAYDSTSSAAGNDVTVIAPADAPVLGRWLIKADSDLTTLALTTTPGGASYIGIYDASSKIAATDVNGALFENRAAIDLNTTHRTSTGADHSTVVANAADLDTHRPGTPMTSRLKINNGGGGGAITEGQTVTIGGDDYEFRASTPPAGGTVGRIWVYQGASCAESLANLVASINGVVNAAITTYDGAVTENFLAAAAGVAATSLEIQSADAPGGTVVASATATATTETLGDAADIWDAATVYGGVAEAAKATQASAAITLTAGMVAKGSVEVYFPFTPRSFIIHNRSRQQNEASTIVGDAVSLTLAGGASPNNQAADVIDVVAFE